MKIAKSPYTLTNKKSIFLLLQLAALTIRIFCSLRSKHVEVHQQTDQNNPNGGVFFSSDRQVSCAEVVNIFFYHYYSGARKSVECEEDIICMKKCRPHVEQTGRLTHTLHLNITAFASDVMKKRDVNQRPLDGGEIDRWHDCHIECVVHIANGPIEWNWAILHSVN